MGADDPTAHSPRPDPLAHLADLVRMCGFLSSFLDDGTWLPSTPLEDLVLRTVARGRGTFDVIVNLVSTDHSLQAAMLGRSLFEDMVVAHWLVLHRDNPEWLIDRFAAHRDAMRLNDAETRRRLGASRLSDDISDLTGREDELRKEFGRYAERFWWGVDESGNRLGMQQLVERLAEAPQFQPRLHGERPILDEYYALQQKAWNQALHHTAAGMNIATSSQAGLPIAVAATDSSFILFGNYWVFGQLIYVAMELGASQVIPRFQKLFLLGLAIFGEALGVPAPWAEDVMAMNIDGDTR